MIKFLDLQKINLLHQNEIEEQLLKVFRSGWYLLGDELKTFEKNLSNSENIAKTLIPLPSSINLKKKCIYEII
jgi:dTDP-4-amino-4,6-dideoxygalactose transaminase